MLLVLLLAVGTKPLHTQLIQSFGWKNISQLIDIELKIMVYKALNNMAPQYLSDFARLRSLESKCLIEY